MSVSGTSGSSESLLSAVSKVEFNFPEITGWLLSRIWESWEGRGGCGLCALLQTPRCHTPVSRNVLGHGRTGKVCVSPRFFDSSSRVEWTIDIAVHEMLRFAQDMQECRKVLFAKCVFLPTYTCPACFTYSQRFITPISDTSRHPLIFPWPPGRLKNRMRWINADIVTIARTPWGRCSTKTSRSRRGRLSRLFRLLIPREGGKRSPG